MRTTRTGHALLLLLGATVAGQPAAAAGPALVPAASFHHHFAGGALTDQDGRPFGLEQMQGRYTLVNFVFTQCASTCPLQTRALAEVQAALPAEAKTRFRFVSVSLDPLTDTPATLKAYARRMGADLSSWSFATGKPAVIERLMTDLRLLRPGVAAERIEDHSTRLWLIDPKGRVLQRYGGDPVDVLRLVRELQQAQRG